MTSVYENVSSILLDIRERLPDLLFRQQMGWERGDSGPQLPLVFDEIDLFLFIDEIDLFLPEFKFLILIGCCNKCTEAEAVHPHLSIKFEATILDIASQVERKEFQTFRDELRVINLGLQSVFFLWTKFRKKASEIVEILADLRAKINLLKPEIREAGKNLLDLPFRSDHLKVHSFNWDDFVSMIASSLKQCTNIIANRDRRDKIDDFSFHLNKCRRFLYSANIGRAHHFSVYTRYMALRAASVFCHWWASQFDSTMEEEMIIALLDPLRTMDLTLPKPLCKMLRMLKVTDRSNFVIDFRFFDLVIPFGHRRFEERSGLLSKLKKEIESLTTSILPFIPQEDAEDEQSFLLDFTLLISEIKEYSSCSSLKNKSLLHNLLARVSLLKVEVSIVEQLTTGYDFPLREDGQIDALELLVQEIKDLQQEHSENAKQILTLMEASAKMVASLRHSFHGKIITRNTVRTMLCLLRLNIMHWKLDKKLHDNRGSLTLVVKDRVQYFLEGLKFLLCCFINQQEDIVKDEVLEVARIEAMTRSVISLYRSLLTQNITQEMLEKMNISDLLDEIKFHMVKLREIYLPVQLSNFPKTNALGFFDALLTKLGDLLLNCNDNFFVSVREHIEEILAELEFFRHCLGHILEVAEKETEELRNLGGLVIDVAYEAEYFVDSIMASKKSDCHNLMCLYHLLQNIRHIKMQVTRFNETKTHYVPQLSRNIVSKSTPRTDDFVLSLNDQQELIFDRLLGGSQYRDIVSIAGMPGIGKTTLAKNVYSSPIVARNFHIRAWCCVTEVYRRRELLLEILSQIMVLTDKDRGMSDEDLEFKLLKLLRRQKYLIVMDDMWSSEAWDDLQKSFPDDENRSRILITSRLNHMDLKAKTHSYAHDLRPLSNSESWDLLKMMIFREDPCPEEFIEVGQEIARNCKGLPLAIVALAGILRRIDRQESQWKEIAENLSSRIFDDPQEQCRDILELSYKLLPDYLRACFLYLGAFPEDQEIPIKKLIRLWIAEGFVQKTELKSLEDLAEDYLFDLIGRSLVMFAQPRSGGGTKACRLHDMLRSLCQLKAKEDKFLQVITKPNASRTPNDLESLFNINFNNPSNYKTYEDLRLCFYSTRNYFVESRPSGPYVQSLLFYSTGEKYERCSYDISFVCHNFKLLKVLDLECINVGPSFPSGIELMVLLRYLAVSGDLDSVPSSIAILSNLETLVVKGLKGKVILPDTIWCLKRLRHVEVSDVAMIKSKDNELGNSALLDHLVTLSSPFLRYGEETIRMLRMFPNLRKLACIFSESPDCSGIYNLFPRLDVLTQLESLKVTYCGRDLHTAEFSFPFSLKRLTLSNFRLPWKHISVIEKLENLEVLKLLSRAYDGETWDMEEAGFHNLKFLKLDTLNISKWNASSDNLPKLQQLVLRNCTNLEEIPSSFVEIPTLRKIEVHWCGKYAEESARTMQEEADEYLEIVITSDFSRSSS